MEVVISRDIEKIVSAILDEMVEALRRGDRVANCGVSERFQLSSEKRVKGAILVLVPGLRRLGRDCSRDLRSTKWALGIKVAQQQS
jgi:hypothetical protein